MGLFFPISTTRRVPSIEAPRRNERGALEMPTRSRHALALAGCDQELFL